MGMLCMLSCAAMLSLAGRSSSVSRDVGRSDAPLNASFTPRQLRTDYRSSSRPPHTSVEDELRTSSGMDKMGRQLRRRGRSNNRGRGRGQRRAGVSPQQPLSDSCYESDEALLSGSGCSLTSPEACATRYILLRVHGNDKFLAPGEQGIVHASVRSRFKREGSVPLQQIAWKVLPQARGYVQLQHVLTGKFLRLVPPPDDISWCFVVVSDPRPFGKQTWFELQTANGGAVDLAASHGTVHLRSQATGAFLNYRTEDFVRGHGNSMRSGRWQPADRLTSTRLELVSLSLKDLAADIDAWAARKRACLLPCENATAAAFEAKAGRVVWQEHCWEHYAEPLCNAMARAQRVLPGRSWGRLPTLAQLRWSRMDCDRYVSAPAIPSLLSPHQPLPPVARAPVIEHIPSMQPGGVQCVPPVDGVLLLAVADRPNQFLCHFFNSALRHGLRPVVLGWNPASWLDVVRKPWTYHLGAKLLLPLHYLQQCNFRNDTLLVFTDQDVVFQGGYADLRRAYAKASAREGRAPLIFSTEKESYPIELAGLYPAGYKRGVFHFLNSGMWAGPVGAAAALLRVMTGVNRAGQPPLDTLMRHYVNGGRLDTRIEKMPAAFLENDQTKYAGLYVAQAFAQSCRGGERVRLRGHGCFRFLHDGIQRCSRGSPQCTSEAGTHDLDAQIGLDRSTTLFENMYHAGAHAVLHGRIVNRLTENAPVVVHFNGPAKVFFENEWRLPWDATAGRTPVHALLETQATAFTEIERNAAMQRYESDVIFFDHLFRRVPNAPFRFQCEA